MGCYPTAEKIGRDPSSAPEFSQASVYGVITPLESFSPSGIMFLVNNKLDQTNYYYAKITN